MVGSNIHYLDGETRTPIRNHRSGILFFSPLLRFSIHPMLQWYHRYAASVCVRRERETFSLTIVLFREEFLQSFSVERRKNKAAEQQAAICRYVSSRTVVSKPAKLMCFSAQVPYRTFLVIFINFCLFDIAS